MTFDFASTDVLLDIDSVCKKLSISRSTLERLRRPRSGSGLDSRSLLQEFKGDDDFSGMPQFPEPTVMLGRSPRWSAKVLNTWISGGRSRS